MVKVDKNLCITCGLCFSTHSEFFALGADGKAEEIKQPVTDEEITSVEEAIANCPVDAISNDKIIEMNTAQDMPMAA